MPVRRDFPYKNLVDHQIEKMKETGVLDQVKRRHLYPLSKQQSYICSDKQVSKNSLVSIAYLLFGNNENAFDILVSKFGQNLIW